MEEQAVKAETNTEESRPSEAASNQPRSDTMAPESTSSSTRAGARAQASSRRRETARDPMNQFGLAPAGEDSKASPTPIRDLFDYDIPFTNKPGLQGYLELIQRRLSGDYP